MEPRAIASVCKVGCCLSHGQLTMPCGLPAQFHRCYCVVGTLEPTRPCPPQMLCRIQIAQSPLPAQSVGNWHADGCASRAGTRCWPGAGHRARLSSAHVAPGKAGTALRPRRIPGRADTVAEARVSPAPWPPRAFLAPVAQPSLEPRMLGFGHLRRPPAESGLEVTAHPRLSAWAATWAKRARRRGPQPRGAQTPGRSPPPADRPGPSTRSTGCSTSSAPSPPGGTGRPASRPTGTPPIPPPSSARPGGAFP